MGLDGCVWVFMDALGHRGYSERKNKANGVKNGCAGHYLDSMAGEISPDIMFLGESKINAKRTLHGHR